MRFSRSILWMVIALLSLPLFSGCATGARFSGAATPPEGKALVYFYRKRTMVGAAGTHDVYANNKLIVRMRSGGCFAYVAEPGDLVVTNKLAPGPFVLLESAIDRATDDKNRDTLRMKLEPNRVYYAEWSMGKSGFLGAAGWVQSTEATARPIIADCAMLEAAK